MYIISKHKDYYDGVVGSMGIDKTLVYERNSEEITDSNLFPKEFRRSLNAGWHGVNRDNPFLNIKHGDIDHKKTKKYKKTNFFIVGFCGKLYLGWKFQYEIKKISEETGLIYDDWETDIIYGYENAKEFLKDNYWRSNFEDDIKYITNYDPIGIFRELKIPIFIYDSDRKKPRMSEVFIKNPVLKDYEFYKVMDAFTAFQEVSMFIGGVLGIGEKEMIEVADKHKITQHGFNKWSFRKEPTKKK